MKALDTRFVKIVVAVLISIFIIWLMSVLQCELATPVY
jgi:hypothetical protein